jgi:hypothetical protein
MPHVQILVTLSAIHVQFAALDGLQKQHALAGLTEIVPHAPSVQLGNIQELLVHLLMTQSATHVLSVLLGNSCPLSAVAL